MDSNKQNATLNLWKLIAAFLIMGHHAVEIGQSGDYIFHGAYVYTEFFFMLSGFFFIRSLEEKRVKGIFDYTKKIWLKLFPYTTIVITVYYLMIGISSGSIRSFIEIWIRYPLEIFYLSDLHIVTVQLGQLWYLASMLLVMPFLSWLFLKDRDLFKVIILISPLIWYGYCFSTWGQLGHRGVFIDLIRAFTNLALGGLAYYVSDKISKSVWLCRHKWLGTTIAWGSFGATVLFTYAYYWTEYDIYCIFYFFVSLIFATSKSFVDIKCLKSYLLAEFSMSIYIVHISVGSFVQRFCGESVPVLQKYLLYYSISMVCAVLLMILVRYIKKYKRVYA